MDFESPASQKGSVVIVAPFLKNDHGESIPPVSLLSPKKRRSRRRRFSGNASRTSTTIANSVPDVRDDSRNYDVESTCTGHTRRSRFSKCTSPGDPPLSSRGSLRRKPTSSPSTKSSKSKISTSPGDSPLSSRDSLRKKFRSLSRTKLPNTKNSNLPPPPKNSWRLPFLTKSTKRPKKKKEKKPKVVAKQVNDSYDENGVLYRTTTVRTEYSDGTTSSWRHKDTICRNNPRHPRNKPKTKRPQKRAQRGDRRNDKPRNIVCNLTPTAAPSIQRKARTEINYLTKCPPRRR